MSFSHEKIKKKKHNDFNPVKCPFEVLICSKISWVLSAISAMTSISALNLKNLQSQKNYLFEGSSQLICTHCEDQNGKLAKLDRRRKEETRESMWRRCRDKTYVLRLLLQAFKVLLMSLYKPFYLPCRYKTIREVCWWSHPGHNCHK